MAYTHSPKEPIAIIGSGCRFPGDSTSPSKFWELLHSPRDLSKEIPSETRFNADGFYHPNGERHGSSNVTMSYFIEEDPRFFDAGFFGIAPREAEAIDPQQRLLLETVYEAMENAGLTLQGLKGSMTSAYVGAMSADYTDTQTRDVENLSQYMITGTSRALLSNRLSYFFDWHGPSISVEPTRDIGVSLAPFLPIEEHEAEGDNPSAEDIGQRDILTDQEGFALQMLFNDPEIEIVDLGNRFDSDGPRLVALQ